MEAVEETKKPHIYTHPQELATFLVQPGGAFVYTFVFQVIFLFATFLLTVFLNPNQFGIFFIVSAFINFFSYFTEVGVASFLIQKKEDPTKEELHTTFIVQEVLALFLAVLVLFLSPLVISFYKMPTDAIYLLLALTLAMILSSLSSIPLVLLERRREFNKIDIYQSVESLVFYTVAVVLAIKGLGLTSFTVAVVARGVVGLVLVYIFQPFLPGISFSKEAIKPMISFGLPYEFNTFFSVLKNEGITLVLGGILGPAAVGILGWAQKWTLSPLRFFMDNLYKTVSISFSHLQEKKGDLAEGFSRVLFFVCAIVFPIALGLVLLAPQLIDVLPEYEKWRPGLFVLLVFAGVAVFEALGLLAKYLLEEIGEIGAVSKIMVLSAVLSWTLIPYLAYNYGVDGAAIGTLIATTISLVGLLKVFAVLRFNLWEAIGKPLLAAIIMGILIYFLRDLSNISYLLIGATVLAGSFVYFIILTILQ